MTYAAEPYAQFVDDLLRALTGGLTRQRFTFLLEAEPYKLAPPAPLVPASLAVFGIAAGDYTLFRRDRDYLLAPDDVLQWKANTDGTPAPEAVWPDEGTDFFANYDVRSPGGPVPLLTDRNIGSVTRLIAESFAREFAVLSRQLESVYEAAFIGTAGGRDLDQVVALVGLERRTRSFAVGTAIFSRSTPAPGDVFVAAGTRLSTDQPPAVVFETTEDRTLRRGDLTVEVPVQATVSGALGIVPARAIAVIHRPILGIETVSNPQATRLAGADETDDALRTRASRAHEGAGKSTTGAILAALTTIPALRDKDIRIAEDHFASPGIVTVSVAAELDEESAGQAVALIEGARAAGIRILHNIDAPPDVLAGLPPNDTDDSDEGEAGLSAAEKLYLPVTIRALLLPASPSLPGADRIALQTIGREVVHAFVEDAGIGEVLVYNRLIAMLMGIEGILDVAVELYAKPATGQAAGPRRRNLTPPDTLRPKLDDLDLEVEVVGEIIAFDVTVKIVLTDTGRAIGTIADNVESARLDVSARLQDTIAAVASPLDPAKLLAQLAPTTLYSVESLHYTVEYLEAGLRVNQADPTIALEELERPWVRTMIVTGDSG